MKTVTPRQIAKTINLIAQSGIERDEFQALLESDRFPNLLREFTVAESAHPEQPAHPEPTITPIRVPVDYARTLVEMRDAGKYDGYVDPDLNDANFPVEAGASGEREFVLVCFNRAVDDNEDPAKSELLRELDKLGLKPEGPPELCAVGEHHPELQREFPIVARCQVWRNPYGVLFCPLLDVSGRGRRLGLFRVQGRWAGRCRFLASRK